MDIANAVKNIAKSADKYKIVTPDLCFKPMQAQNLQKVNKIIIHHSANDRASDTAKSIHSEHLSRGWAGIGYHFLIRADGTIEKGRPQGNAGAHCVGANTGSLGICLSGNFEKSMPTAAQIQALIWLIAKLLKNYRIICILPHSAYDATACPGRFLRDMLADIWAAANKYAKMI